VADAVGSHEIFKLLSPQLRIFFENRNTPPLWKHHNMGDIAALWLFEPRWYPFVLVVITFILILYYISLPQAAIYGSLDRAGGTILQWRPVHKVVQNGYNKVRSFSNPVA